MSKICFFTGKKTKSKNKRSHAMNKTKIKVKPNLKKIRILTKNHKFKKVWVSIRSLKSKKN